MTRLYAGGWVVTCDDEGAEHESGWLLVEDGVIAAVGSGEQPHADERVDLDEAVVTPGLVNTHHHLYQTLTRARAQQADLFSWLRELYPVWSGIDAEAEYAAARTGLAELALSGCSTVFTPSGRPAEMSRPGETIAATSPAPASRAARIGHATRGRPQTAWSIFGVEERIRVPSPAAMTRVRGELT